MSATPNTLIMLVLTCFVCQSLSASPTLTVGGRLDLDAAKYHDKQTPLASGVELRRLRLEFGGALMNKLNYYVLTDFSNGSYSAQASWLRYRFNRENELYAGRIEIPFSLQRVTSSKYNLLMERALPAALTSHYGTGLVYLHKGPDWSWRVGLFGDDKLNFGGKKAFGTALAARVGRRLRLGKSRVWLGASAMVRDTAEPRRVRSRPETSVSRERLVDAGRMKDVNEIGLAGLEGVWKRGQWSVQGEWIRYRANRTTTADAVFSGGYIEASRTFNGRRRFNFRRGEWMSPEVTDMKTWELALRVSYIDLQDDPVAGGRETNYSLGLNYYLNPINRIQLNWIKADAHPNSDGIDESPSILQVRLQIGF